MEKESAEKFVEGKNGNSDKNGISSGITGNSRSTILSNSLTGGDSLVDINYNPVIW